MGKLPDLNELIEGCKAQCGIGVLFYAAMLWFLWGFVVVAGMPFLWLFATAGYDPIAILAMSGGGWFGYGSVLSIVVTEVNFRKGP